MTWRISGRTWSPGFLGSSLALWLDAADANTIILNGSTVAQWNDKSGNNRNATQGVAANQPTYTISGLNGKPIITFNGSDVGFTLASAVGLPRDMVSVSQGAGYLYSANTTTERVIWAAPGGANFWWGTATGSPNNVIFSGRNATSTFIEQYTTQGLAYEIFLNGVSSLSGSVGTTWTNNNAMNQIGLKWASATGFPSWTGTIAEIVWTNTVMSLVDRQKLEGYLAWKWGLVANLPANHPFKTFPPSR